MALHLPSITELRNTRVELERFKARVLILQIVVLGCFVLLLSRLVSLEITPSKVEDLEATIQQLSEIIDIQPRVRKRFKRLREESKSFDSLPIRTRLSDEEVARFSAQHYRFPGVEIKARLFRQYPYGELASHVIGYIGRINASEKERIEEEDENGNYRGTEYIGKLGVEQSYERELHGTTGVQEVETSAGGRAIRRLSSRPAIPGKNIVLSIDIKLQKLVEDLYCPRRGALVAMDPGTGEVLAFVSKPTFDPNLFVEGIDVESWQMLNESIDKPLLNRALRGTYPPGSTYKPFMALAALTTGKRSASAIINDAGSWTYGGHTFRSHGDHGRGPVDMVRAIVLSSNVYYYSLANELGVDTIHDFMKPLGFGQITGIDLPGEVRGVLPSTEWKRKTYKRPAQQKWYGGETISLGIGQGYNTFTMLQLATATSALANGGHKNTPRVVRATQDALSHQNQPTPTPEALKLDFKPEHLSVVRNGLVGVTTGGTSAQVFAGAAYTSAGKTGTAQAVTIGQKDKYNAAKLAEHQRDHALYMAFAPAEAPRIALAVIVENAGLGAAHAAPIARRMFDYWLLNQYPSEEDIAATQKGLTSRPVGTPRNKAEVPLAP